MSKTTVLTGITTTGTPHLGNYSAISSIFLSLLILCVMVL